MPRRGEFGDTTQRCAYCGKPQTTWLWSNWRARYCSHRCLAADTYYCNGAGLCCFGLLSWMMYIAVLNFIAGTVDPVFYSLSSLITLSVFIWIFPAYFGYTFYVGYTTARETSLDEVYKNLPPETSNYD